MSTYFITGANRGIGFALAQIVSANKENKVVATTRSLSRAEQLQNLKRANIEIIELDVTDSVEKQKSALSKLKFLQKGADVVVQNAGIFYLSENTIATEPIETFVEQFEGNALASVKFYQAIYLYWKKPTGNSKKLIFISSVGGSMGGFALPTKAYGLSKAAVNFLAKHIAVENASDEELKDSVTISLHPGVVLTDMGKTGIEAVELLRQLAITPEESAEAIYKVIGEVKPEQSGEFLNYDGTQLPY